MRFGFGVCWHHSDSMTKIVDDSFIFPIRSNQTLNLFRPTSRLCKVEARIFFLCWFITALSVVIAWEMFKLTIFMVFIQIFKTLTNQPDEQNQDTNLRFGKKKKKMKNHFDSNSISIKSCTIRQLKILMLLGCQSTFHSISIFGT